MKNNCLLFRINILFILIFLMFSFEGCSNKKGMLEEILDEYIKEYKISPLEHYLLIGSSDEAPDSTSALVISFRSLLKDKPILEKGDFKSKYKDFTIYSNKVTVPNGLKFEKIDISQEKAELLSHNDYFNDLQLILRNKNECILNYVDPYNNHTNSIMKELKNKGLICN